MLCPNDNTEMRQVKILSQYGGPVFVDQCEKCGGIWFDESELFRAGQGEAERIEAVNLANEGTMLKKHFLVILGSIFLVGIIRKHG